jgi:hypothetical protein
MLPIKEVNTVYQTKNYGMFKFRNDNREVNQTRVKQIASRMIESGWLSGSNVIINSKNEIIDGQHRVKAAIIAGVPINYIVEKKAGFETIRGLNQDQKNWSLSDYVDGFTKENNEHYIRLKNFMKEFPHFNITEAMMFLQNGLIRVDRNTFESGGFKTKNVTTGKKWAESITELKPYFEKGYNRSIFVRAMIKIFSKKPEFKMDEFVKKVSLRPGMLYMCGTVDQYVDMIEKIYNHHRRNDEKVNLRF